MSEKLSEQHLRVQKVEVLTSRLLKEVHDALFENMIDLDVARCKGCGVDEIRGYIEVMHRLYVLEDFLKHDKGVFMRCEYSDEAQDVIEYTVGTDTLDWMVQNGSLLSNVLFHVETSRSPIEAVLSDKFFEHQVFGIWERALWSKEKESSKGETVEELIGDATQRSGALVTDGSRNRDQELGEEI